MYPPRSKKSPRELIVIWVLSNVVGTVVWVLGNILGALVGVLKNMIGTLV